MSRLPPIVAWCAAVACAAPVLAAASSTGPAAIRIAGNDDTVWVAESRLSGQRKSIRLYYGDTLAPGLLTSPTLPDRFGELIGMAVDDDETLLLYVDHTSAVVTIRSDTAGPNWPGKQAPIALAGDAIRPDIYAISEGAELELVLPTPAFPAFKTATRPTRDKPARPATTRPAAGLTLLRMHHRLWEVASPVPPTARHAKQFWLAARDGKAHLFWRAADGKPIECSTFADGEWSAAGAVPGSKTAVAAWAAADRLGPVLTVLTPTDATNGECELRVAWRKDDAWFASQALNDKLGKVVLKPNLTAITVARAQLAIARLGPDGKIELGTSALDGDRTVTWERPINLGGGPLSSAPSPGLGWIEALTIMIVMAVIVWTRQEMLATPLPLPKTVQLADPGRRLAATIIDLLPAVAVTAPLWVVPLSEFGVLGPRLLADPELAQSLMASRIAPSWYLVVAVYAVYCGAWEGLWGSTPGKRLLGCRVISASGGRPTVQQVVVRNVVRIPELGILLVAASSLFLMLAISRNRQRIGDAVAGTFVIRPAPPLARPVRARAATSESREEDHEQMGV